MSFGDHRVLADQPALETTICWLTNELWRPVRADWLIGFGDLDTLRWPTSFGDQRLLIGCPNYDINTRRLSSKLWRPPCAG